MVFAGVRQSERPSVLSAVRRQTARAVGDFQMAIVFVAIPLVLTVILSFRLSSEDGTEIPGDVTGMNKF